MIKALVLVICLALAHASESEFDRQMDKLENSKFGRTLLQTIFMQIQTEDPVANLIAMMQNLEAQIDAEQRRDDDRYERVQAQCSADLEQLKSVLGQATTISMTLKTELDQLNPQKTAAVANLNRKNKEIVPRHHPPISQGRTQAGAGRADPEEGDREQALRRSPRRLRVHPLRNQHHQDLLQQLPRPTPEEQAAVRKRRTLRVPSNEKAQVPGRVRLVRGRRGIRHGCHSGDIHEFLAGGAEDQQDEALDQAGGVQGAGDGAVDDHAGAD